MVNVNSFTTPRGIRKAVFLIVLALSLNFIKSSFYLITKSNPFVIAFYLITFDSMPFDSMPFNVNCWHILDKKYGLKRLVSVYIPNSGHKCVNLLCTEVNTRSISCVHSLMHDKACVQRYISHMYPVYTTYIYQMHTLQYMKRRIMVNLEDEVITKVEKLAKAESRSRKKMLELLIERNC